MLHFSAALLSRALGPLIALFSSPCGRHSTVSGRRRRRSTRVRRYAPAPASAPLPASAPTPRPLPLAPPSQVIEAEDVALVRPYFVARENQRDRRATPAPVPPPREPAPTNPGHTPPPTDEDRRALDRAKAQAKVLLQQWKDDPGGDLLGEPAPAFQVVRPRLAQYAEWDELTAVTRVWIEQRSQGALV